MNWTFVFECLETRVLYVNIICDWSKWRHSLRIGRTVNILLCGMPNWNLFSSSEKKIIITHFYYILPTPLQLLFPIVIFYLYVQFKHQAKEKYVEEENKILAPLEQVCQTNAFLFIILLPTKNIFKVMFYALLTYILNSLLSLFSLYFKVLQAISKQLYRYI